MASHDVVLPLAAQIDATSQGLCRALPLISRQRPWLVSPVSFGALRAPIASTAAR